MAEVMLSGDLLKAWKFWHKTESSKEKEGSFKKEITGKVYKKKYVEADSDLVFKYCLGKVRSRFIKNYDARKQKVLHESRAGQAKVLVYWYYVIHIQYFKLLLDQLPLAG